MPKVEIGGDGVRVKAWFKTRQVPWSDIDRILLTERAGTAQRNFFSRPGPVYLTRVTLRLEDGEVIVLRRSFSQYVGPDEGLRRWAEDLQRRLHDARPEKRS